MRLKRTRYNGELRAGDIGQRVVLTGWVQKKRNLGSLIFVDLRDRTGICQVVFDEKVDAESFEKANGLRGEFVIAIEGVVHERESKNADLPTGDIEIFAEDLEILNASEVPPIHVQDDDKAAEKLRLKYRYLDLRKPKMQRNLLFRNKVTHEVRSFLESEGFIDVETPVLTRPTPEGARDYLVPSRVNPGHFYALPQSPQLFKQILMVSGIDRYYQIVKCFRDEDLRADRQPEFTQIDIEMSFVDEEDVFAMNERLMQRIFKSALDVDVKPPFQRMPYDEAMERFGSDKPDIRFGFELVDATEILADSTFKVFSGTIASGGHVRGINVKGYADSFSRKDITKLEDFVSHYGAKGLAWLKTTDGELAGPIAKFLSDEEKTKLMTAFDAADGDLLFFVADKPQVVFDSLGALRVEVAKRLDLLDKSEFKLLWVTDFPLFEHDEEAGRYVAKHHPFTSPKPEDEDLLETAPDKVRARAYDLVLNGVELGGGSIRIHRSELQSRMFKALGFTAEEAQEKFGFLLEAFKYGTPPHGGIAYGLDRIVMLLTGADNIREVIAFPKTQNATDLMTAAPGLADEAQLAELGIQAVTSDDE